MNDIFSSLLFLISKHPFLISIIFIHFLSVDSRCETIIIVLSLKVNIVYNFFLGAKVYCANELV